VGRVHRERSVHYQYDPIKTMKTNVMGTLNMLGIAKRTGARFLLASTSEVYGDPEVHPQVEEYRGNVNTTGIRSWYRHALFHFFTLLFLPTFREVLLLLLLLLEISDISARD
jgi:hypothetical protein